MTEYNKKEKREYYLANREKRLAYQNKYYRETRNRVQRRREIDELLEPEKEIERKKRLSDYNRAYYVKNKDRIMAKRKQSAKWRDFSNRNNAGKTAHNTK